MTIYELREENEHLRAVLKLIAEWDSHTAQFHRDYGSNGVRDFYRAFAKQALNYDITSTNPR